MFGKDERAYAYEHYGSREKYAAFVCRQYVGALMLLTQTSLCNKYGIVVTLSEDEGGKYYVYNVKLYAQHSHDTEYPYPT